MRRHQLDPEGFLTCAGWDIALHDIQKTLSAAVRWDTQYPPRIVLLAAPCRSGTTAFCRVVGYSGTQVVYQPVKEALRTWLLENAALNEATRNTFRVEETAGESLTLPSPASGSESLFLKETFGAVHPLECRYSPVRVLLDAGFPADRLRVVAMMRDPLATFASWVRCWGDCAPPEVLAANLVAASENTLDVADEAARAGVGVKRFDFDRLGREDPLVVLTALFQWAGLATDRLSQALAGWSEQPHMLTADPRFAMPRGMEQTRYLERVHHELLQSSRLTVTPAARAALEAVIGDRLPAALKERLDALYAQFVGESSAARVAHA